MWMGSYKLREEGGQYGGSTHFYLSGLGSMLLMSMAGVMFERSCRVFYGTYIVGFTTLLD